MHFFKRGGLVLLLGLALLLVGGGILAQDDEIEELASGNNAFAFDLYQAIQAEKDGNLIFSPFSISQALAMTFAGASGETAEQMADVLHYNLPQDELHAAFASVMQNLNSRSTPESEDEVGQRMKLNIANALWGLEGFPFLEAYMQTVEDHYGAGLQLSDFINAPEATREEINDWIAEQTEDRIQDVVPEGAITPLTRLVLANAIYFNATWLLPFEEFATQDEPFTTLDGLTVTVPMMNQQERFFHMTGAGFQALELSYYGDDVAMLVILPDEGEFEAVEDELSAGMLASIRTTLKAQEVALTMPRWEYEFDMSLPITLAALGMPLAFDPDDADFSNMADLEAAGENIFIGDVLHKAFVKVDEEGTEAAAITVVMMETTTAFMGDIITFRMDRPFIYAIYDKVSGSVLFMGRVVNPAG